MIYNRAELIGWYQWLFLIEGVPTVLMAIVAMYVRLSRSDS